MYAQRERYLRGSYIALLPKQSFMRRYRWYVLLYKKSKRKVHVSIYCSNDQGEPTEWTIAYTHSSIPVRERVVKKAQAPALTSSPKKRYATTGRRAESDTTDDVCPNNPFFRMFDERRSRPARMMSVHRRHAMADALRCFIADGTGDGRRSGYA